MVRCYGCSEVKEARRWEDLNYMGALGGRGLRLFIQSLKFSDLQESMERGEGGRGGVLGSLFAVSLRVSDWREMTGEEMKMERRLSPLCRCFRQSEKTREHAE